MEAWQKYAAELLGTFVLVFGGTTTIVAASLMGVPVLLTVPFAFGLALLAGLYAFGEVSGGHYNPAVSLAMFLDRRLSSPDLVRYWAAQFAGAILASLVLLIATSQDDVASTATVPGVPGDGTAFLIELVFTAIFVLVILQASASGRFGSSALVAIPLALVAIHFAAIPFSGSSVNPARTFGPALIGNEWDGIWIYFIAPPLGAALAVAIHRGVVGAAARGAEAPVAEVLEEETPAAERRR
ncbi:MAG TPA: aquaporin [Gaiellaceae bacterium]|jgi:aquaporin Z|nr:aquaporin [Gaiellaceae bacterium]